MAVLRAGDVVLASASEVTRVIAVQHVGGGGGSAPAMAPLLRLEYVPTSDDGALRGTIELTLDHVLSVDGRMVPAREVRVGSTLDAGRRGGDGGGNSGGGLRVERVVESAAGTVVNPQTTSGTILAAAAHGAPVVATTFGEWIAVPMLSPAGRLACRFGASSALSYLFPQATQAFYDRHFEGAFDAAGPGLVRLARALPAPLAVAAVVAADLLVAAGFVVASATSSLLEDDRTVVCRLSACVHRTSRWCLVV